MLQDDKLKTEKWSFAMGTATREQETTLLSRIVQVFPYNKLPENRVRYLFHHEQELADLLLLALSLTEKNLFQTLLWDCHQNVVDEDINESIFPLDDDGTGDLPIIEYCFNKKVSGYVAESSLERLGYKPVGLKRAMEYVAKNPDSQKFSNLIVLGAQWRRGLDNTVIPVFNDERAHGGRRYFNLAWQYLDFNTSCRFLVVKKVVI